MIYKKDIDKFHKLERELSDVEQKIIDRIDELIRLGAKICEYKNDDINWYFDNAQKGEMGTLKIDSFGVSNITIDIDPSQLGYSKYINWFSDGLELEDLYMTDEEFEKKYVNKIKERVKKLEEKYRKDQAVRDKNKKIDTLLEVERKRLMKEID